MPRSLLVVCIIASEYGMPGFQKTECIPYLSMHPALKEKSIQWACCFFHFFVVYISCTRVSVIFVALHHLISLTPVYFCNFSRPSHLTLTVSSPGSQNGGSWQSRYSSIKLIHYYIIRLEEYCRVIGVLIHMKELNDVAKRSL